jgi:hypothetical protein
MPQPPAIASTASPRPSTRSLASTLQASPPRRRRSEHCTDAAMRPGADNPNARTSLPISPKKSRHFPMKVTASPTGTAPVAGPDYCTLSLITPRRPAAPDGGLRAAPAGTPPTRTGPSPHPAAALQLSLSSASCPGRGQRGGEHGSQACPHHHKPLSAHAAHPLRQASSLPHSPHSPPIRTAPQLRESSSATGIVASAGMLRNAAWHYTPRDSM